MTLAAPFVSTPMEVIADWIDYNGHLNMAYYNVLFDRGLDQAFDVIGIGVNYARDRKLTIYTAEVHVCYVRELHLGDRVTVSFRILDHDDKRVHGFQEIRHVDGWLAATSESMSLHIDMSGPKVAPFPPDVLKGVEALAAAHASLPRSERVGRAIGITRKSG